MHCVARQASELWHALISAAYPETEIANLDIGDQLSLLAMRTLKNQDLDDLADVVGPPWFSYFFKALRLMPQTQTVI